MVQADEAVFDAVQAKFLTLTTNLLPKLVGHASFAFAPDLNLCQHLNNAMLPDSF